MPMLNTYQVVNAITACLFQAEDRRLQKWLNEIVTANYRENRLSQPVGFIYGGTYYRPDWQGVGKFQKCALHSSLWDQMDAWIKDKTVITDDRQMISQTLFSLIETCDTDQGIRDALPECLVSCIEPYRTMKRDREEAWTLKRSERQYRQYQKLLPKIEMYAVSMLIY